MPFFDLNIAEMASMPNVVPIAVKAVDLIKSLLFMFKYMNCKLFIVFSDDLYIN
jgi:hypothetical protein